MKRIALGLLACLIVVGPAAAADLPYAKAPLAPITPAINWSGFYVGAVGGYASETGGGGLEGALAGGTAGYNFQSGAFVAGIEVDAAWSDIKQTAALPPFLSATDKVRSTGTVRGRVGVAFDSVLLYGTGGYAWADNTISFTLLGTTFSDSQVHSGWVAGAGIEWMFARGWSMKAEYLYRDFGSENYFASIVPPGVPSGRLAVNSGQIGINYHF